MIRSEMINRINIMLGENLEEELLSAYLDQALDECIAWEYGLVGVPEDLDTAKYDALIVNAVIFGISIRGAEGENQHSEKGILRGYKWSDMADYIHQHLPCVARIR